MTKHVPLSLRTAACLLAAAALASCSGSDSGGATGGSSGVSSGGSGGTAGTTTGSGGRTATSGGSGGVQPAGGSGGAGGASLTDGSLGNGGSAGGSSASGGTTSSGGASSNAGGSSTAGGTTGTGGSRATGGTSSSGGSSASGGTTPAGGSSSTGGSSARGGTTAAGGTTTTGGTSNSGGSSGGASTTGGSSARGGTTGGTGGTTGAGGITGAGGGTHTGPWKIMALGDSITATTCYPQLLYQDLKSAGHTNFTFIGSVINNQGCGVTSPAGGFLTEGHSGKLVVTETNSGNVASWFKANPPDIVVMHFATNDVWGNGGSTTANNIISAYTTLLTQLRTVNPNAIMFVAQIIPVNPSMNGCSSSKPCNFEATVDSLIPAWATSHNTTASPVIAVNLEALYNNGYFPGSTYTSDGVHPTLTGSQPMGSTVAAAIIAKGYF